MTTNKTIRIRGGIPEGLEYNQRSYCRENRIRGGIPERIELEEAFQRGENRNSRFRVLSKQNGVKIAIGSCCLESKYLKHEVNCVLLFRNC